MVVKRLASGVVVGASAVGLVLVPACGTDSMDVSFSASGGSASGGAVPGGASSGGAPTGGTATGGSATGGTVASGGSATGGTATGGTANAGAPSSVFECDLEFMRLFPMGGESEDGAVSYLMDSCIQVPELCVGGCYVFSASFSLSYLGRTDHASSAQVEYTSTHHNWSDSLVATLPDRRLFWRTDFDSGGSDTMTVAVEGLDGVVILPETEIVRSIER